MSQHLFNLLTRQHLSPNQYCLLWHCKHNIRCTLLPNADAEASILMLEGFLNTDHSLTSKAEACLAEGDLLFKRNKVIGSELISGDYIEEIKKFRDKFPQGKRSTPPEVSSKFVKFFALNPAVDWDTIQRATDLYISESRDEKYIMKAANFIMVDRGGITVYALSEYIERVEEGETPGEDVADIYDIK